MYFKEGFQHYNETAYADKNSSAFNPDQRLESNDSEIGREIISFPSFNPDKRIAEIKPHEDGLYTTREDRVNCTNLDKSEGGQRGEWEGERGDSKFIPSYEYMKEILAQYGRTGVEFINGVVDFSPFAIASVKIDEMTANRPQNFRNANQKLAEKFNQEQKDGRSDWTARQAENYVTENKLTWHECSDMHTVQLVPTNIHNYFKHSGGVAECRVRDRIGGFDE